MECDKPCTYTTGLKYIFPSGMFLVNQNKASDTHQEMITMTNLSLWSWLIYGWDVELCTYHFKIWMKESIQISVNDGLLVRDCIDLTYLESFHCDELLLNMLITVYHGTRVEWKWSVAGYWCWRMSNSTSQEAPAQWTQMRIYMCCKVFLIVPVE